MRLGTDIGEEQLSPELGKCLRELHLDFVSFHFFAHPTPGLVKLIDDFCTTNGLSFMLNQEQCVDSREQADRGVYRKPGCFFSPPRDFVEACTSSPRFLGVCYDEAEHWTLNGVFVTANIPKFIPHFYDAEGDTLEQAYEGNLQNLCTLMQKTYAGFTSKAGSTPFVGTENVFPVMQHVFARAGFAMIPKLLKESMLPVHIAEALGASRQYGTAYWTCDDLWFKADFPGHTTDELRSALLFSYWTGAEGTYVEAFDDTSITLATCTSGTVKLAPRGELVRWFADEYMPAHPKRVQHQDIRPDIVIVRFPDTDWGQLPAPGWITGTLYGASNLLPNEQTRYWIKIWNVLSHGVIPGNERLNWNQYSGMPYRFFIPANNVVVYDHLASDPALFSGVKLVLLSGTQISDQCMKTLRDLVPQGLTVVTTRHLAPPELARDSTKTMTEHQDGKGAWIVTDDITAPEVRARLAPFLGKKDELRYVFGKTEVIFTAPESLAKIEVKVRELPATTTKE